MIRIYSLRTLPPGERRKILDRPSVLSSKVMESAARIVNQVRAKGDAALRQLTKRFDKVDIEELAVSTDEGERASKQSQMTLRSGYDSVVRYHEQSIRKPFQFEPVKGINLGRIVVPLDPAGIYVPGGRAAYPTTVLMAAAAARVAGVRELVLCTPPGPDGNIPVEVLFAASIAKIPRVYRVGGAQAISAMAYGTDTIPKCEIIVGPGNAYVTAAKKLVRDDVAIDFLAGPTEIVVVSDGETAPNYIAADLVAQAEHDPEARCVLVTTSEKQARIVATELESMVPKQERSEVIRASLTKHGVALVADDLDQAFAFANEYGAEHLTLSLRNAVRHLKDVRSAGAVFVGEYSPVATGDYCVGPNHILPTLGDARLRGGLTADTFLKSISYEHLSREGLNHVAPMGMALSRLEGLDAHGKSIEIRLQ